MNAIITTSNPNYPLRYLTTAKGRQFKLSNNINEQKEFLGNQLSYKQRCLLYKNLEVYRKVTGDYELKVDGYPEAKQFVKLAAADIEKAKLELVRFANILVEYGLTKAFKILNNLRYELIIMSMSTLERRSLIEVLTDTVDVMYKNSGEGPYSVGSMFLVGESLSTMLVESFSIDERLKYVIPKIENGKSVTWLFYWFLRIMHQHSETNRTHNNIIMWLVKDELEIIKKILFERLQVELNGDFYQHAQSRYLFIFWHEVGTKQQVEELRLWLSEHLKNDLNFLNFVGLFPEKALDKNDVVQTLINTRSLNDFIKIEDVNNRLDSISHQKNENSVIANDLKRKMEMVTLTDFF